MTDLKAAASSFSVQQQDHFLLLTSWLSSSSNEQQLLFISFVLVVNSSSQEPQNQQHDLQQSSSFIFLVITESHTNRGLQTMSSNCAVSPQQNHNRCSRVPKTSSLELYFYLWRILLVDSAFKALWSLKRLGLLVLRLFHFFCSQKGPIYFS